ncbi:MAG: hypothetical protein PWQ97_268 [Tepidanaerobacteraceae bacterium]|nr:hypothetical protein [Tepidanaerobacteraceae bacterium]
MSQQELLKIVVKALENANIQYMITGSIVSSLQGEPRLTHDIDLIIAIQKKDVKKIVKAFSTPEFYISENGIYNAIKDKTMFNLIDIKEGDKVDFWILTNEPFDISRFSRRYSEDFMGIKIMVSSPEDTILAKLRWAKMAGGSEKHFIDALRVYEVQYERLDMGYIDRWAQKLGVETLWKRIKDEAEII